MVQPLTEKVPAFCLSCVGTDNKFNAELVLKRWRCIYSELQKRNVHLMSYAADGDSRELKAMQAGARSSPRGGRGGRKKGEERRKINFHNYFLQVTYCFKYHYWEVPKTMFFHIIII